MKRALTLVQVLVLALGCPAAWADVTSTAAAWNVTASLVDLDPGDGIAASITFNDGRAYNGSAGTSLYEGPWSASSGLVLADGKFGPVSVDRSGAASTASASVTGDGTLAGAVLQAQGSASGASGATYYGTAVILRDSTDAYSTDAFTLSPHTRVVFSADYSLYAHQAYGAAPPTGAEAAVAYVQLLVFGQGSVDGPLVNEVSVSESSDYTLPHTGVRGAGTVLVSFENLGAVPQSAAVGVMAAVNGQTQALVPEPAPAAMLALGLAVIAWRRAGVGKSPRRDASTQPCPPSSSTPTSLIR